MKLKEKWLLATSFLLFGAETSAYPAGQEGAITEVKKLAGGAEQFTLEELITWNLLKLKKREQAGVVSVDQEKRTVKLNAGRLDGVREGNFYYVSFRREKTRFKAWQPVEVEQVNARLKVTEVHEEFCIAKVMNRYFGLKYHVPTLTLIELLGRVAVKQGVYPEFTHAIRMNLGRRSVPSSSGTSPHNHRPPRPSLNRHRQVGE